MNSDQIFDAIEDIAAHPGKKDKERLVAEYGKDHEFLTAVRAALDPFITYGVRKVPTKRMKNADAIYFPTAAVGGLLVDLSTRKLSGNAALEAIQRRMDLLTDKSAELLTRIIKKDLRAGFGDSTVNKAFKGLIPTFPYMRCSLPSKVDLKSWDWDKGVISQEKADGMFVNVTIDKVGQVTLTTRQGNELPIDKFPVLAHAVAQSLHADSQVHGELLVVRNGKVLPREIGNGMLNSIAKGGDWELGCVPICRVWDIIPFEEVEPKGKYKEPYAGRLAKLRAALQGDPSTVTVLAVIETRIVHSLEDAYAHYRELLARGKEGTILKQAKAIWKDGTSTEQVKLKLEVDVELEVIGFEPGKGKNEATFGSIICKSADGDLIVSVSGFSDLQRTNIHLERERVIGRIMAVRANSIMFPSNEGKPHSLFLPRFIEWRDDKSEADTLQQIKDQFESAIAA